MQLERRATADGCRLFQSKRHKTLAKYFVNLDPDNPPSEEDVVALIKRRLEKFDADQLAAFNAAT